MSKTNCWTVKNCGREPGGANAIELGICPAASDNTFNGVNKGTNAGRVCWAVTGTICEKEIQGTFAQKQLSCMSCEFFRQVRNEEENSFIIKPETIAK